ncbi:hypothetical protein ACVISU_005010 [Bradyrhizobium sp. USDA 4452]
MRLGRPKALTMAQQFVNLQGNPLTAGRGCLRSDRLTWTYATSPSPLSRDYLIRIEMAPESAPRIFVDDPDVEVLAGGRDLPHVYHNPTRLCLYLPGTREWQPWMRLDQTVVPWTALWLFYFEDWLDSDEWKGGGMHPAHASRTRRNRRRLRFREPSEYEIGAAHE